MIGHVHREYVVCHAVRGRLRVKVRAIRFSKARAHALERSLAQHDEVRDIKARSQTGSVILYYDPRVTRPQAILELLMRGLDDIERTTVRSIRGDPTNAPNRDREGEGSGSAVTRVATAVALTGFLAYYLVRTIVQRSPVSQTLLTIVTVIGGLPLLRRALSDLGQGRLLTLNTFLASASGLAIATGEAATALEVLWVRAIGEMAEGYVADRSRRAISEILQLSERNAFVLVDGVEVAIPIEEVRYGDTVVVRAGEKIPVDGVVAEGEALVDEAHITGRKEPEPRTAGESVLAGTVVQQGTVRIDADKVGHDTYLSRIGRLVEESLANRAPAEKQADLLAARLTTIGFAVTGATLVLTRDLAKGLAVFLMMSCPCATVLAAATAVSAALANAARNLILIKGGLYLERFGATDCVCFDKTGTLTTDQPRVSDVVPRTPWIKPETIIGLAASVEHHNPHPVARAIVRESQERGYPLEQQVASEIWLGRGVRGESSEGLIAVGNLHFMEEQEVDVRYFKGSAKELEEEGRTIVYVAKDGKAQGMIGVVYEVRASTDSVLEQLRDDGVSELHLISGDSEPVVRTLARELGFDGCGGSLLPEEKAHYLERLRSTGRTVAIVGDGVNDALALSKATVGVAMCAGGAEAAIAAADVALVDDDLARLIFLRRLSHQTLRVIEQNYWLALSTDLIGAAFGTVGLLTPVMAGAVHVIHTFGIFLNSSRLLGWKPKETNGRTGAGSRSTRTSRPLGHMEEDQWTKLRRKRSWTGP